MQKRVMKILGAAILVAAVVGAGLLALLKLQGMYQGIHGNINRTRTEMADSVASLSARVNALEAQVRLAAPDMYQNTELRYDWTKDNLLIAHALGGLTLDGFEYEYTNSKEAFLANYEKGIRVFEVDLLLSSDGGLVAVHNWKRYGTEEPLSFGEFQQGSFYDGRITQMTGADLVDLLMEYPDIYLVTDTKYTDVNSYRLQFSQLVYLAQQKDALDVLDRVIVQIYHQGMYDTVYEIYPWKSVIYTLYQSADSMEDVVKFCTERGIQVVTMGYAGVTAEVVALLKEAGITTYSYTVNDPEEARRELDLGVGGFYTDSMSPLDFE